MAPHSNEMRQQFELHDLDGRMRRAYEETSRVDPREHVRRLKAENLGMLIMLAIIVAVGCYLAGLF